MKAIIIILRILLVIIAAVWLGLLLKPRSFPPYPKQEPALETVPLPDGLPQPVARFYHQLYGDQIPLIRSAVISGHAKLRIMGITFPGRFRFTHTAGQDYRHYIESTLFGLPIMKVNERYLDGVGRMELPFGITENDPKLNESADLGLWAESIWLPSLWVTDERVRWEAVDENTASLIVPFEDQERTFTVHFDPESGMIDTMETMRYREADDEERILWVTGADAWGTVEGKPTLVTGSLTWMDQGKPWAVFTAEELLYNVDVEDYMLQKGL